MNKVTIKFWDVGLKAYAEKQDYLLVIDGDDHRVYEGHSYVSYGINEHHLEAHFYKDGERIA